MALFENGKPIVSKTFVSPIENDTQAEALKVLAQMREEHHNEGHEHVSYIEKLERKLKDKLYYKYRAVLVVHVPAE